MFVFVLYLYVHPVLYTQLWCVGLRTGYVKWLVECSGVLPSTEFVFLKGLDSCDELCVCSLHCKVHWRVGRRKPEETILSSCQDDPRLLSESFDHWTLDFLCCLYWHQFDRIGRTTLVIYGCRSKLINVCQEYRREVFWDHTEKKTLYLLTIPVESSVYWVNLPM